MRETDFERLYDEHAQPLFGFLAYRTGDRMLAEDLLADTFERVLLARRGPRGGKERAWIYAIAMNVLRDQARRRDAETRALVRTGGGDSEAAPLDAVEARDAVGRAMAVLSDEEREAVALRFGADLTVPEVARVLGEPLDRVEGRVYRALRKMRGELGED